MHSGPQRLKDVIPVRIDELTELSIFQRQGTGSATGWLVWPVALDISKYIIANPTLVAGKRVLELGSGTGLVGMVSAISGANAVVVSDLLDGLPMCSMNVSLNLQAFPTMGVVQIKELMWGNGAHLSSVLAELERIDVIIGSDIVYHQSEVVLTALVETILQASNESTVLLIAYEDREGLIDDEPFVFGPLRDRFASLELVDLGANRCIYIFTGFRLTQ